MKGERIPLFPLEVVLFPGMLLPLHIFEPRYKLMIGRCLETHSEFGVVLAKTEGIAAVGCSAEVIKVVRKYPDGRMDILTAGQSPCQVLEVFDEQPYLEAAVEFLDDVEGELVAGNREKLLQLFAECYTLIHGSAPQAPDSGSVYSLAFHIAGVLPLDVDYKQALLEMRAEAERQSNLIEHMEQWRPQLTGLERARRKAGGNGHGQA